MRPGGLGGANWAGVVALAGLALPGPAPARVTHLASALGVPIFVRLPLPAADVQAFDLGGGEDETRPAVLLREGESRSCQVSVAPGSRLVLDIGLTRRVERSLRVSVRAEGRSLLEERVPGSSWNAWHALSAALPVSGFVSLEFRVERMDPPGASDPDAEPWIALGSPRIEPPRRGPRRVLVWISQDAVRADHLGAYGYPRTTSPRLDRFAQEAVLFENASAPASWTLPSLASQFASRYPSFHGAVLETSARDPRWPTVFEVLREEGFAVLGVTGNRFVGADFRLADGFDALHFSPGHAQDLTRSALAALDEVGEGDLALFVHYMDAHFPYEPPAPWTDAFDPGYRGGINGRNFFERRKELTERDLEHVRALYDGGLASDDAGIGELLDGLRERKLLAGAVLVYSADHGEGFLEHGRLLHAGTVYEELLHVPLVVRVPGVAPRRVPDVVSLVDVAPTVLEALGVPRPDSFQGRSLQPLLRGARLPSVPVYAETDVTNNNAATKLAVREGPFALLLKTPRGASGSRAILKEELFDLTNDPLEQHPLAGSPALGRLRTTALAYLAAARTRGAAARSARIPRDVEERLRALGYSE